MTVTGTVRLFLISPVGTIMRSRHGPIVSVTWRRNYLLRRDAGEDVVSGVFDRAPDAGRCDLATGYR